MKQEKKSLVEFLRSLFRKRKDDEAGLPSLSPPTEETVRKLIERTMKEVRAQSDDESRGHGDEVRSKSDEADDADGKAVKESCPYATRRAIVESIAEIRRFTEEHKLAATVIRSLLTLLAEIAIGALNGKVSRPILETLLRAINYEPAIEEAFRKGHEDGRNKSIEERYPSEDDGLPHINGTIRHPDTTNIFDVAAEARR